MTNNTTSLVRKQASYLTKEAQKAVESKDNFNPYLACMNCKHSIIKFLNSYLIDRNIVPSDLQTMSVLLVQCQRIDPAFNDIDLSAINCRHEKINEDHCTDRAKLEKCVEITGIVEEITQLDL